jgi:hypothetical protein
MSKAELITELYKEVAQQDKQHKNECIKELLKIVLTEGKE